MDINLNYIIKTTYQFREIRDQLTQVHSKKPESLKKNKKSVCSKCKSKVFNIGIFCIKTIRRKFN